MNFSVIFSLCFLTVVVFCPNENSAKPASSDLSLVLQRLDSLDSRMREMEKFHGELKTSLEENKETNKKWRIFVDKCSEDELSFRASVRGSPGEKGQKGEKGQNGQNGQNGERGQRGQKGPKGDSGLPVVETKSITSCSDAMEKYPFTPRRNQTIYPFGKIITTTMSMPTSTKKSLDVLCDLITDEGGWTIIQKRSSGPQLEFYRNWTDYVEGFGSIEGNFWLGLENIHTLTKWHDQELRIDMEDFEGNAKYAKYSYFSISDASDFYRLAVGGFSGSAGDSFFYNPGRKFTTKDMDNDVWDDGNCANWSPGSWWYSSCGEESNLNGHYREKGEKVYKGQGITWYSWKGKSYSLAKTEMKIRTKKFQGLTKQKVYPHGNSKSLDVLFDFKVDGGRWIIIQRRSPGPFNDFDRSWDAYVKGFGSLNDNGNFWLGLENIHALTKNGDQELRIELEDFEGNKAWAKYSSFSIANASEFYQLSISGFLGDSTAGDSMTSFGDSNNINGMRFNAKDVIHGNSTERCENFQSGWWFNNCGAESNLNGIYEETGNTSEPFKGIIWASWKGAEYSLAKTEMKIRTKK